MTESYIKQIANLLQMLHNLDRDLNLVAFNETEKKIFYTIAYKVHNDGKCNISDVIESSGFSRLLRRHSRCPSWCGSGFSGRRSSAPQTVRQPAEQQGYHSPPP